MKVIKRSCDLPIAVLHAHPDNPRKDVGDVTELAESIKQNGIFQMTPNYACGLIQAHLPYIKKENIANVYPLFEI